jgi:hypothetical protein
MVYWAEIVMAKDLWSAYDSNIGVGGALRKWEVVRLAH